MIVIHSSPHLQRHVVYTQDKLFKIQPGDLPFPDLEIKSMISDPQRFCFWEPVDDVTLKSQIVNLFKEKGKFNLFTSEFKGIKCSKLLYTSASCRNHDEEPSERFKIDISHIFTFIKHIIESVKILSDKHIYHQDLNLNNIIVFPNDKEFEQKTLFTSLPIIIDFGLSKITPQAASLNLIDVKDLFFTCRYGMCRLNPRNPTSWIIHVIPEDQYSQIKEKIDRFIKMNDNLSFEYLLSLV